MSREMQLERLTELLKNMPPEAYSAENIANYLYTNGIIAPPVKVGDTVYEIICNRTIKERKIIEILIADECSFVVGGDMYAEERYHFSYFGKDIFLEKTKAEMKIEEYLKARESAV